MSLDRTISWPENAERKPTREQIGMVCEDLVAGAGTVVPSGPWDSSGRAFVVNLPGPHTRALRRVVEAPMFDERDRGRGFEVWISTVEGCYVASVRTWEQDDFTSAIADRLAGVIAQFWEGKVEV